jgi:hypothetical protein
MPTLTDDDLRNLPPMVTFPIAARALGIGLSKAYELRATGDFPVPVIKHGSRGVVQRSALLRHLGIAPAAGAA